MKIWLAEDKKYREKQTRRARQSELKSQIAISGGWFQGFGSMNDRPQDRSQQLREQQHLIQMPEYVQTEED